jgi:hypothetical protein
MKDKKATFINITPAMAEILKLSPDEITLEKFVESFIKFASENKYVSEEQKGYVIRQSYNADSKWIFKKIKKNIGMIEGDSI